MKTSRCACYCFQRRTRLFIHALVVKTADIIGCKCIEQLLRPKNAIEGTQASPPLITTIE